MPPAGCMPPSRRGMFRVCADGPVPAGAGPARFSGRTRVRPRWCRSRVSLEVKAEKRGEFADVALTLCLAHLQLRSLLCLFVKSHVREQTHCGI